ncbi:MAG: hypothetical protein WKF96_21790 [Solirubrobacteraceae bacterium]
MTPVAHREEVVNVLLADLLKERGTASRAETIVRQGNSRSLPDITVDWLGVRIIIEGKFAGAGVAAELDAQVAGRLDAALGDVGIALMYPVGLRTDEDVRTTLIDAPLRARFSAPGKAGKWIELHGADGLAQALDQARAILIDDDAVTVAVDLLRAAISVFERAVLHQPGRLDEIFAIVAAADAATAGSPSDRAKRAAAPIAALAVCTAAMLQAELAKVDPAVPKLPALDASGRRAKLLASWRKVLEHDYAAIFSVGADVLDALEDDPSVEVALTVVADTARTIMAGRALGRHDVVGRVYHTLLSDQKYLATYFTSVPAATLLCHLALQRDRWPEVDWSVDPAVGLPIRFGDLACGTGTLLVATAGVVRQTWAAARAEAHLPIDQPAFSARLVEDGAWGYDVLSYALQICASTLLLGSPGCIVHRTRLHKMPFGGTAGRLGSLELLDQFATAQLWGDESGAEVGLNVTQQTGVSLPSLDFIVMNPPFTRSVGGSQLLGSLDGSEFTTARARLSELVRRPDVHATLTAGLGAPFVELAQRAVKPGGRLALVLPKSVLTGEAWEPTRSLIASLFHLETAISSHEAGHWNFSDSTSLSEVMLVARKWREGEPRDHARTDWIALAGNPDTAVEALGIVSALRRELPSPEAGVRLRVTDDLEGDVGEAFSRPAPTTGKPWRHATFSRASLDSIGEALLDGAGVRLPGASKAVSLPLVRLSELATIGYDRRDITDAFERVPTAEGYPALWGQDAEALTTLNVNTNAELRPRSEPAQGRARIKPADQVWAGAGRLMIVERLRAVTYRAIAVTVQARAVANTWWSINLDSADSGGEEAVALWLNSSLGIASFLAAAEETEGPWIAMKKNKLKTLPVLDPRKLSQDATDQLAGAWAELSTRPVQAVARLDRDPIRARIDETIADVVGLPRDSLEKLRVSLAAEPRFQPVVPSVRTATADPAVPSLF